MKLALPQQQLKDGGVLTFECYKCEHTQTINLKESA
jgi:hypothetical protein